MEARYAGNQNWYRAEIVGRRGDSFVIKWASGSFPELRACTGGVGDFDKVADLVKDSTDLRVLEEVEEKELRKEVDNSNQNRRGWASLRGHSRVGNALRYEFAYLMFLVLDMPVSDA